MDCVRCGSAAVTERPERTARGYRRFRCRDCGKQYNGRSGGPLYHTQYPSDVIALAVLWHLRYRLTLRDLAEMSLVRGIVFSHEAVREWEAKLAPMLADELRRRRHGRGGARGRHWHVGETYDTIGEIRQAPKWSKLCALQLTDSGIFCWACLLPSYGARPIFRSDMRSQAARRFRRQYQVLILSAKS